MSSVDGLAELRGIETFLSGGNSLDDHDYLGSLDDSNQELAVGAGELVAHSMQINDFFASPRPNHAPGPGLHSHRDSLIGELQAIGNAPSTAASSTSSSRVHSRKVSIASSHDDPNLQSVLHDTKLHYERELARLRRQHRDECYALRKLTESVRADARRAVADLKRQNQHEIEDQARKQERVLADTQSYYKQEVRDAHAEATQARDQLELARQELAASQTQFSVRSGSSEPPRSSHEEGELLAKVTQLENDLLDAHDVIDKMELDAESAQHSADHNHRHSQQQQQQQGNFAQLKQQNDNLQRKVISMENALDRLKIQAKNGQRHQSSAPSSPSQRSGAGTSAKEDTLQHEVADLKRQLSHARATERSVQDELRALKRSPDQNQRSSGDSSEVQHLRQQIASLEHSLQQSQAGGSNGDAQIRDLRDAIDAKDDEIASLVRQVSQRGRQQEQQGGDSEELSRVKAECDSLRGQLSELQRHLDTCEAKVRDLESAIRGSQRSEASLFDSVEQKEKELEMAQSQLAKVSGEHRGLDADMRELFRDFSECRADLKLQRDQHQQARATIQQLEARIEQLSSSSSSSSARSQSHSYPSRHRDPELPSYNSEPPPPPQQQHPRPQSYVPRSTNAAVAAETQFAAASAAIPFSSFQRNQQQHQQSQPPQQRQNHHQQSQPPPQQRQNHHQPELPEPVGGDSELARIIAQTKRAEEDLLKANMERDSVVAQLNKLPTNPRRMAERRQKQQLSDRLEDLDRQCSQFRTHIRRHQPF